MAFFPRNFYHSEGSFTPLFRLLEDFDNYSRKGIGDRGASLPSWQPKFDVTETTDAFELHGELPGINKDDVHIEFTDPQTVVIRGKTEREYTAGTPPAGFIEGTSMSGAITEGGDSAIEGQHNSASQEPGASDTDKGTDKGTDNPTNNAKFWLTERSIGEFSRRFNFPTQVDQDSVTASFKHGILSLVVPKAKRHKAKRITID